VKYLNLLTLLLITLLPWSQSFGQYYNIGQARSSVKWLKIETHNFRIVFPTGYERDAINAAAVFEMAQPAVASGLHTSVQKIPLLMHTESLFSNAYSIWAPRRIEILTTPPQDMYAQPWMQQLALHEYRHIVQLSKLNQGITKSLGYLFGQQAVVVSTGLFVPSWFLEGDAVASETAFSNSGRGRVPDFAMPLHAQLMEKGAYSYAKASLGSYRDFVPDNYVTGYYIVAVSRKKYGNTIWNTALNDVARKPWTITPFNHGLKSISGLNKKGLYRETTAYLDSLWKKKPQGDTNQIRLAVAPDNFTNYNHPHRINDSVIVALKTSMKDIPRIVSIGTNGSEQIIHTPGYMPDDRISYSGGWMAWAEFRPHIRWEKVGFTTIVMLNPADGEIHRIQSNKRRFSPVEAPDNSGIAFIEIEPDGSNFLVIQNQDETLKKIPVPEGMTASAPAWSPDGSKIALIIIGNKGKAMALADLSTSEIIWLTPFSTSEISNPVFVENHLFFTGTTDNTSQICSLDLINRHSLVITKTAYGAKQASVSGNQMVFADYTADGYRIANVNLPAAFDHGKPFTDNSTWPLAEVLTSQENGFLYPESMPDTAYKIEPYRKGANLFGIHSWAPLYIDIGGQTARPGASVMSQNLLSTLDITAGYDYNISEETGMFRSEIAWKAWYPVFKASVSSGMRASMYAKDSVTLQRFTWNETTLDLSISQTLTFSQGYYNSGMFAEVSHNYTNIVHNSSTPDDFIEGTTSGLTYKAFGYIYRRQAFRDLAPRIGMNLDFSYRHTPFGQIKAGNIAAVQTQIFLPGFVANHSISIYAGIQSSNPEDYKFSDILSISRGYTNILSGDRLICAKATYRLPLFYPDFHIGGLAYIKRLRAGAFFDLTQSNSQHGTQYYNSAGLDLISDMHLLGLSAPVSMGLRSVYLLKTNSVSFGLLFSINLYQF